MPAKQRPNQKKLKASSTNRSKRILRFSTPQVEQQQSRTTRRWRTSGLVDKQSTLTQIDFIRRPVEGEAQQSEIELEDESIIVSALPSPSGNRKRKRGSGIVQEAQEPTDSRRRQTATCDDKENDVTYKYNLNIDTVMTTPKKFRGREVPSSQSPTTPLSTRSNRRALSSIVRCPLQDVSNKARSIPHLQVEDTFKTNDLLSSPHTTRVALEPIGLLRTEVMDSDEELSDSEALETPDAPLQHHSLDDTTLVQTESSPQYLRVAPNEQLDSEAEISKPPLSDDLREEDQKHQQANFVGSAKIEAEEVDTLDDAFLLRSKRTYSARRRLSSTIELPSSSSLEEIDDSIGELSKVANETSESQQSGSNLSSKPSMNAGSVDSNNPLQDRFSPESRPKSFSSSPAPLRSDSQQAIAQLQQESQWQAQVIPSSQASTASMRSSPLKNAIFKTPSKSNKRGWFFNPLTDSQLLPESIMNFELPNLPSLLVRKSAQDEEDLEEL